MKWSDEVEALFVGGSLDGETLTLPASACTELFNINPGAYFIDDGDNDVSLVISKASVKPEVPWLSYGLDVYKKRGKLVDRYVIYDFSKKTIVDRCEHYLQDKDRRCGNSVTQGSPYCPMHNTTD